MFRNISAFFLLGLAAKYFINADLFFSLFLMFCVFLFLYIKDMSFKDIKDILSFVWMRIEGFSMEAWDWYALIIGIFLIVYPFLFIQISVKKMFNKTKFLREPTEIEVDDQGLSSKNSLVSGTMKWESYLRFAANDRMLILLQSPRTMTYIPRHIMNDQEWTELLNLVKNKLPSQ
jgi:hypothetical protein